MIVDRRALLGGLAALPLLSVPDASARPTLSSAARLLRAARSQIGVTLAYDPAYTRLGYPGGDVPRDRGVCTDVVIRAYRDALALDLQSLVHDDMRAAFSAYPRNWGLKRPDRNIDHRRVPNLATYMTRAGARRALPDRLEGWRAGDIATMLVGDRLPHIGIVSDRIAASGRPMLIHNIGAGTREEDVLAAHRLTGRFRFRLDA